ncbi:MAG: hypothetical protein ACLUPF_00685 [Dorea sp.]
METQHSFYYLPVALIRSKRLVLLCELPEESEESETNGEDISMEVF